MNDFGDFSEAPQSNNNAFNISQSQPQNNLNLNFNPFQSTPAAQNNLNFNFLNPTPQTNNKPTLSKPPTNNTKNVN